MDTPVDLGPVARRVRSMALVIGAGVATLAAVPALAQTPEPTKLYVRPGQPVILDAAPCVRPVAPPGLVEAAKVSDTRTYAIFRMPPDQVGDVAVTFETGPKALPDGACDPATSKQFTVTPERTPQIGDDVLQKSFRLLLHAFVLALLLESAFALLFNWRLFLEFFGGKAWRTPIMFAGAWLIVRAFDLDLMATLFAVYHPSAAASVPKSTWFTSAVTAMILAGGSVGVNRILVGLGFRSLVRPEAALPDLHPNEAWVAVRVYAEDPKQAYAVNITEAATPSGTEPTVVGVVRTKSILDRLRDVLFPSRRRVPNVGGRSVDTTKVYRVTVSNLGTGRIYDAFGGREVAAASEARVVRFGSRAIVDLEVAVP